MRSYDPDVLAHLNAGDSVRPRRLVWITARRIATGATESLGLWDGDDDHDFVIGGVTREYRGAGGLLGMDDPIYETGLVVRRMNIWLTLAAPEVLAAAMDYDLRLAPVEVHRIFTDPHSHLPIAAPHRIWKGFADGAPSSRAGLGSGGKRLTLTVASAAMALTQTVPLYYSDEAMKARSGDRAFRYADVSGDVPVYWGEAKHSVPQSTTTPPVWGYFK